MVLSRDMQGRFTRNCCRPGRKLGGTVCSPLQTRFRPPFFLLLYTELTPSFVFGLPPVLLVPRPADCRSHSGHDGKHPLRVLLPCCDDMAGCTRADERGCAEGKRGCEGVCLSGVKGSEDGGWCVGLLDWNHPTSYTTHKS